MAVQLKPNPPHYTESPQAGECQAQGTHQRGMPSPSVPDPDRPHPEDLVLVGLKGMIPLTMNQGKGGSDQSPSGQTAGFSIEDDPLLRENVDPDHRAFVGFLQHKSRQFFSNYKSVVWKIITAIVLAGYTIYFGFAIAYSPYGAIAPCVFTGFGLLFWAYYAIKRRWGKKVNRKVLRPTRIWWNRNWNTLKW